MGAAGRQTHPWGYTPGATPLKTPKATTKDGGKVRGIAS
jgi:hypothetical protein